MIAGLSAVAVLGIAFPHLVRLERTAAATAVALWAVSLALRALLVIFGVLYLAFFLPGTEVFASLTHWCWHTVLPLLTAHLGLEGHKVGDAATIIPGLLVMVSVLSVGFGVIRAARAVRRLLARDALGPGPADSVIVGGPEVMLAAAGLTRPQVVVTAGALLELDDEELAAGLDHERGHIARRHRWVLVFAELCRGIGRVVPGCRRGMRELEFHLERDADAWALRRRHDRLALASAICKAAGIGKLSTAAASPLTGGGAEERLGQLMAEEPPPPSRVRAAALNAIAITMVCATVLMATFIPSTALAGAQQLGSGQQVRHCED